MFFNERHVSSTKEPHPVYIQFFRIVQSFLVVQLRAALEVDR